jgi:hypothetical protein
MSTLDEWTAALCAELGIEPTEDSVRTVLDLARVVAHAVDRPAAPVTAYFLGMAVGRGATMAEATGKVSQLAEQWAGGH